MKVGVCKVFTTPASAFQPYNFSTTKNKGDYVLQKG